MAPWFDRPLSVAGHVLVDTEDGIETRLVNIDRDLLVIPSLAIHMNRAANDGVKLLANIDTLPLLGSINHRDCFLKLVAEAADCRPERILGHDLSLYVRQPGVIFGAQEEYLASPKLDDLACVFTTLEGFLAAKSAESIPVLCVFDNEEVGSQTRQGAASTMLRDTLRRVTQSLGMTDGHLARMLDESFLLVRQCARAASEPSGICRRGQLPVLKRRRRSQIQCQPALRDQRRVRRALPQAVRKGGREGAGLRQPLGYSRRLDARLDCEHARAGGNGRHRACAAGDALLLRDGRRFRHSRHGEYLHGDVFVEH